MPFPVYVLVPESSPGPDPTTFLSTVAGTSAAMVAIIGGLLVARFVAIGSDQDVARRLVDDAASRLTIARRRLREARDDLRDHDIRDFFQAKVIRAIGEGEHDPAVLRRIADYTLISDDEIRERTAFVAQNFDEAESTLQKLLSTDASQQPDRLEWQDFKLRHASSLPPTLWETVWRMAYETLVLPQPSWIKAVNYPSLGTPPPIDLGDLSFHDLDRRNELQTAITVAKQRVEDTEDELDRLTRERNAIRRPGGLGWGLVVLSFFTVVGVIIPIYILSTGPDLLTTDLGEVVFWLFFTGLVLLLVYMGGLALRLSGWHRKTKVGQSDGDATAGSESTEAVHPPEAQALWGIPCPRLADRYQGRTRRSISPPYGRLATGRFGRLYQPFITTSRHDTPCKLRADETIDTAHLF